MTTLRDAIAVRPVQVPVRPTYALGVLLDADDFFAEQGYHRGRWARALKYLYGTGTIAGLRVLWREATQQLVVEPGLALDPLGRLIEVARPLNVLLRGGPNPDDAWFEHVRGAGFDDAVRSAQLQQDLIDACTPTTPRQLIADVFVRLAVCARARTPAFSAIPFTAGAGIDALDATAPTRLRDGAEVALVVRPEAHTADGVPLPDDSAILATRPSDRSAALAWAQARVLAAWRDTTEDWTGDDEHPESQLPHRLNEHLVARTEVLAHDPSDVGRDPRSVLLARVRIPVDTTDPPADLGQAPTIDNTVRRFVRHAGWTTQPVQGVGP